MAEVRDKSTIGDYGRYLDLRELRAYTRIGRDSATKLGRDAGAVIKIGRRVVYDRTKIDEYMESMTV